jgi:hypothetical protein
MKKKDDENYVEELTANNEGFCRFINLLFYIDRLG